jgi:hypothetical protein
VDRIVYILATQLVNDYRWDAMRVHYGGARVVLSRQETKSLRLAEGIEDCVAQQMVVQVDDKGKQR